MPEICRSFILRVALAGVVIGSSLPLYGCGESEPPKVIDTTRGAPKAPSQDGGPGMAPAKAKSE